jgi:mannitol operon repressor
MDDKFIFPQLSPEEGDPFFSHYDKLGPIITELNRETDRGAALFSASILDDVLKAILAAFLIDSSISNELFNHTKPLGSFSSRQDFCYALGLISKVEYDQCNLVRKIRNEFAHTSQVAIDFNSGKVSKHCTTLRAGSQVRAATSDLPKEQINRITFIITVSVLHWRWTERIALAAQNKRNRLFDNDEAQPDK